MVNFIYSTQNPVTGDAIRVVSATQDFTSLTNARAFNWIDIQNTYPVLGLDGEIRPMYRLIHEVHSSTPAVYDVGAKYAVLRETQDLRKTQVTSTTAATGSLPASSVTFVPAGNVASTNVQSAIEELDAEKVPLTKVAVSTAMMTEQATGFTLAGGTTSKTLTVPLDASVSGTNTGDNATNSTYTTLATTLATANTWTANQTFRQTLLVNNPIAAVGNAATVPITYKLNTITNDSASTLTITMATAGAVDGQLCWVRILDFSAVAQTLVWVNTEDSLSVVPTTSNGSTTLFKSVGFMFNGGTSKWRCEAVS